MPYRIGLSRTSVRPSGGAHATWTRDGNSLLANALAENVTLDATKKIAIANA